jgi:hypothetical protein
LEKNSRRLESQSYKVGWKIQESKT